MIDSRNAKIFESTVVFHFARFAAVPRSPDTLLCSFGFNLILMICNDKTYNAISGLLRQFSL